MDQKIQRKLENIVLETCTNSKLNKELSLTDPEQFVINRSVLLEIMVRIALYLFTKPEKPDESVSQV